MERITLGIRITSRDAVKDELDLMHRMVRALDFDTRRQVESIYCDSHAGWHFIVTLRRWDYLLARSIGYALERAAFDHKGGHGGIFINGPDDQTTEMPACDADVQLNLADDRPGDGPG